MQFEDIPAVDGRLAQAVSHPLRISLLRLLATREKVSLGEALTAMEGRGGISLRQVRYQVFVLERLGLVERAERQDRGGVSVRATEAGERLMLAIGNSSRGDQA
jgi:DNA-binding transcriptional ArsR family regulator